MSLSALNRPSRKNSNDKTSAGAASDTAPRELERPGEALGRLLLDRALTPKLRRLFKAAAKLIIIKTQDEATARLLDTYIAAEDHNVVVEAYCEPPRPGKSQDLHGRHELAKLQLGRTVILISPDPKRILVPEALVGADVIITVPPPNLAVVRQAVQAVTGQSVRGLHRADIEGLGVENFVTAIRPLLSARECVFNLRRASKVLRKEVGAAITVTLGDLAMTRSVSAWALETLDLMEKVEAGKLKSASLIHACLEGPPGTGKTTLAEAMAGSAGWTFVRTSVGEWFASSGGHLGDVIRAARRFFDEIALATTPIVGLIDEIDSLPNRAAMDEKDSQWWTPVVTFVLTEIDKLRHAGKPILLLGATNHFEKLDGALIRPGRLERRVPVLLPDAADRQRLFACFLGDRLPVSAVVQLARLAIGASPARIKSWCETALAQAQKAGRPLVLRDVLDLVAPPDGRSPHKDRVVALHEAGHAVAAIELGLPVHEVSILGIGEIGGYVKSGDTDTGLLSRGQVERIGTMMLGGRAADEALGSGGHAGAAADLESVNSLLRAAILDFGLYGSLRTAKNTDHRDFKNGVPLAIVIDIELNRFLKRATEIVIRRQTDILRLVDVLIEERVITGERLDEILGASESVQLDLPSDLDQTPALVEASS